MEESIIYKYLPGTILTDNEERAKNRSINFNGKQAFYVVVKQTKNKIPYNNGEGFDEYPAYWVDGTIGKIAGEGLGSFSVNEKDVVLANPTKKDIEELVGRYERLISIGTNFGQNTSENKATLSVIKEVYADLLQTPTLKNGGDMEPKIEPVTNVVSNWQDLPEVWRVVKKLPKVAFTNSPYDKGFQSIVKPFVAEKEERRPTLNGVLFDVAGITATDAYKFIHLPYPNNEFNGSYCITTNCKKNTPTSGEDKISGQYPDYKMVLGYSDPQHITKISVYKMRAFCRAIISGKYGAFGDKQASNYVYGKNAAGEFLSISFNSYFLEDILDSCLKLGWEYVFFGVTDAGRGVVIAPHKETLKNPKEAVGKKEILLLMPVQTSPTENFNGMAFGAENEYEDRKFHVSYNMIDDEIYNADGKIAEFDINLNKASTKDLTSNQEPVLRAYLPKNATVVVTEFVLVKAGVAIVTDLQDSAELKNINKPDGIYRFINDALSPETSVPESDYPTGIVAYGYGANRKQFKKLGKINRTEFLFNLEKAVLNVGKDELRPSFNGVHLVKSEETDGLIIEATNASTLYRNTIKNEDLKQLNLIIGNPKKVLAFLKNEANTFIEIYASGTNISFVGENMVVTNRLIDGKFPNVSTVIPTSVPKLISADISQLKECIKTISKEEKTANLTFSKKDDKTLSIDLYTVGYSSSPPTLLRNLCAIPFEFKEGDFKINKQVFLSMPAITGGNEQAYFTIPQTAFGVCLNMTESDKLNLYFTAQNKALIIRDNDITADLDVINAGKKEVKEVVKNKPKAGKIINQEPENKGNEADINALNVLSSLIKNPSQKAVIEQEIIKLQAV